MPCHSSGRRPSWDRSWNGRSGRTMHYQGQRNLPSFHWARFESRRSCGRCRIVLEKQMADTRTPEEHRRIMPSVKTCDTGPEITVRRVLHGLAYRYRE
jgi:hypothetical protein